MAARQRALVRRLLASTCVATLLSSGTVHAASSAEGDALQAKVQPATQVGAPSTSTWQANVLGSLETFRASADLPALNAALDALATAEPSRNAEEQPSRFFTDKLRLLVQVFNLLDARIVPGFDFSHPPSISLAPPVEYGGLTGVAPEAVHDPRERAAYERNIAANQAKLRQYSQQLKLREAEERCSELFREHLAEPPPSLGKKAVEQLVASTAQTKARRRALEGLVRRSWRRAEASRAGTRSNVDR